MRDVARIRCDQPRVIKVDDPVGTLAPSDTETSTVFSNAQRSGIVSILISSRDAVNLGGARQFECKGVTNAFI
jgi:hypothetical protein